MANLRVNKITGTEVFETTGSVQFSSAGTRECLIVSSSSDFAYGTGDFTIEGWVLFNSNRTAPGGTDGQRIFLQGQSGTSEVALHYYFTNQQFELDISGTGTQTISYGIGVGQWFHVALVRTNSTKYDLYVDGKLIGTKYSSRSQLANNFIIGGLNWADNYGTVGHISNVRIVRGAVYTKNFTPPTRELTVIPNTVLLCCQSTTRANEERTGKTITVNGNAVANELTPGLLTDRVKSGGDSAISGSVEFDGNDYLLESTGAGGFNASQGDWTIESWMYCGDASQPDILINAQTASTDRFYIQFIGQTIYIGDGTSNIIAIGGVKQVNSWFHIAVTKSSSTYRAFINGILIGSSTSGLLDYNLDSLTIGYRGSQGYYTKGFISNLRIVKGTALYTSNFIPPTRELKKLPGTVLLCCQDSTNPLQEATGKTISLNGSVTSYSVGIGTTTPNPRNFTPPVGFDGTVVFDGVTKINTENYFYLPTGNTEDRGRGRGVFGGGADTAPSLTNILDFVNIQSSGVSQDFGDLSAPTQDSQGCSSVTRGIFAGGQTPVFSNTISFITISTQGNAIDFGADLTFNNFQGSMCSSSTRGLYGGGTTPTVLSQIDYITIASTGLVNTFGNLTESRFALTSFSSPVRGIFSGGAKTPTIVNTIDYVNIASTGNAQDFGDISDQTRRNSMGASSQTRGLIAAGYNPSATNAVHYITISSTGNSQDFGDLTRADYRGSGTSNSIRGIFAGGYIIPSTGTNRIDYVTIASTGNASDFGDLYVARHRLGTSVSDSHGGLG